MPTSLASDFKRIREAHASFLRVLWEFNFRPAAYLHESHRSHFFPELTEQVWNSSRVVDQVSAMVLEKAGLLELACFELPHKSWSLALLPTVRVNRLARHVGALLFGPKIRQSLARDQALVWKSKLGSDGYLFAMNSGSLLATSYSFPEDLWAEPPEAIGYDLLAMAAQNMPDGMRERFLFKLPISTRAIDIDPGKANRMVHSVFDLLEGEWSLSSAAMRS